MSPRTPPRAPLWTWLKVVLVLAALDALLFRVGVFWALAPAVVGESSITWGLLYQTVRRLEFDPHPPPTAYLVGSSVLFLGVGDDRVNDALDAQGVPARVTTLTTFGSSATDSAILAGHALEHRPWLVVYAAASRDFGKRATLDTPVARVLVDSEIAPPPLAAASGDERIARWVRRVWRLYRYRTFVRSAVWEYALAPVFAPPPPAPPPSAPTEPALPPEALERFHFARITPESYQAWLRWYASRRWQDYVGWLEASGNQALKAYVNQRMDTYGPDDNPQVASLHWMLERVHASGTRALVLFFPENPAFRDPEAAAYFDAALSDAYARVFADEAAATGARFVDLRDLLPAEDFHDMIHPNLAGMRTLSARVADLVAEEWRAR